MLRPKPEESVLGTTSATLKGLSVSPTQAITAETLQKFLEQPTKEFIEQTKKLKNDRIECQRLVSMQRLRVSGEKDTMAYRHLKSLETRLELLQSTIESCEALHALLNDLNEKSKQPLHTPANTELSFESELLNWNTKYYPSKHTGDADFRTLQKMAEEICAKTDARRAYPSYDGRLFTHGSAISVVEIAQKSHDSVAEMTQKPDQATGSRP